MSWELRQELEELLDGTGALSSLLWAASSPSAVPPRVVWEHNFRQRLRPCWVWIRLRSPGESRVRMTWGDWGVSTAHVVGDAGLIWCAPTSARNPPIVVELDREGWVDFGSGGVPPELNIPRMNPLPHVRPLHESSWLRGALGEQVRRWFGVAAEEATITEFRGADQSVTRAVLDGTLSESGGAASQVHFEENDWMSRLGAEQVDLIRVGRGLSWHDVARAITSLGTDSTAGPQLPPITRGQVRTALTGGQPRHIRNWHSRLDTVLRLDGYLGVEKLDARTSTPCDVQFPHYWSGPVWVELDWVDPSRRRAATLRWGWWEKRLEHLDTRTVVSTRTYVGAGPLVIESSPGCRVSFGTGRFPGARNESRHWTPVPGREREVVADAKETLLTAIGRSVQDIDRFKRRRTTTSGPRA